MQRSRRNVLFALAGMPLLLASRSFAAPLPPVIVHKDPNCGCCVDWVVHMREAGFAVTVKDSAAVNRIKARLGVPSELASCHTAEVGGYLLEGHVPASTVKRLVDEKPQARGLAVPGMPIGSPGMEVPGTPDDTYDVVLFGPNLRKNYARFHGGREIGS